MKPFFLASLFSISIMTSHSGRLPDPASLKPVKVVCTDDYSEGVVKDRAGNLYFSHVKIISKLSPQGKLSTWAETGGPNGHKILPNGHHLVCETARHAVLELDENGKEIRAAAERWEGHPFDAPNDLTLDDNGGFYFTDPGNSNREHPTGNVYHAQPDGTVRRLATGFAFPNGIALSQNRKQLYLGESERNRILVWDLDAQGVPKGEYRVFAELPPLMPPHTAAVPDGMALDSQGRLWVAHYGTQTVNVLSPDGKLLATYDAGNELTSNVAFAGPKGDQLFLTGGTPGCLFRLDVGVKGLPLLPDQRKGDKK